MTTRQFQERFSEWFLKPLVLVAPYLRTNYWLVGQTLMIKRPFRKSIPVLLSELDEIGVETTDQGPFVEDLFWVLKQGELRVRIPDPHPVFQQLMERFGSLEGFDWQPFVEATSCPDNRCFQCWKRVADTD